MITNYGELKNEIQLYLYNRKDLEANIPTFIQLAEKKIFRALRCRENELEVSGDLTGTVGTPTGFTLPNDFLEMKFVVVNDRPLERKSEIELLSRLGIDEAAGEPRWFARILNEIVFWRPSDNEEHTLRYVYWQTQEDLLVDDADTTRVLILAPELYLFASLIEAMPFLVKDDRLTTWQAMYSQALDELDHQTKEGEYAGSPVSVSNVYSDPIRGIQSGRRV